jgi:hypothetical protein
MKAVTTGKTIVVMQLNSALRRHTAKISLSCDKRMMHGNETEHGKGAIEHTATSSARQRGSRVHGKEKTHGKERSQRTAKNHRTAKAEPAHGKENSHGKGAFAVRQPFAGRMATEATHGRENAHGSVPGRTATSCPHGKALCRAIFARRTAKSSLPSMSLPCLRCRAWTHGSVIAVRFDVFAVRYARTAKHCSPVVSARISEPGLYRIQ